MNVWCFLFFFFTSATQAHLGTEKRKDDTRPRSLTPCENLPLYCICEAEDEASFTARDVCAPGVVGIRCRGKDKYGGLAKRQMRFPLVGFVAFQLVLKAKPSLSQSRKAFCCQTVARLRRSVKLTFSSVPLRPVIVCSFNVDRGKCDSLPARLNCVVGTLAVRVDAASSPLERCGMTRCNAVHPQQTRLLLGLFCGTYRSVLGIPVFQKKRLLIVKKKTSRLWRLQSGAQSWKTICSSSI